VGFVFIRTYGHRGVLVIKDDLSDKISSNDPQIEGETAKRIQALEDSKLAKRSAGIVQGFIDASHNVIEYNPKNGERIDRGLPPANYVLVRDAGNKLVALPSFPKKWSFRRAVCIAENGVMKATCMLAGFNSITVPEFSTEATLDFIFDNIDSLLPEYDFVYAHIKSADEASHDGDFKRKQYIIEAIDSKLENLKNFDGIVIITCDHITSCEHKNHMPGPVPVLVYGKKKDKVGTFDELSAKKGSLKRITGRQLWKYVFSK
jgi:2,3-bisphosphoglycerate-independent phosphoglycerate mutase